MSRTIQRYLEKRTSFERWPLQVNNTAGVRRVVVIPALAELHTLPTTLVDLATDNPVLAQETLIICVINNRREGITAHEDIQENLATIALLTRLQQQIGTGTPRLGLVNAASAGSQFGEKDGVGLARKIGLDWGLRILVENGHPQGALISLDADTHVPATYLPAVAAHFEKTDAHAAVIPYAHALDVPNHAQAIMSYELHLRCFELGLRYMGSPYAFHTIGSAMACTGAAYAAVGGMPARQAAEDFYFLQQLAKCGPVSPVAGTQVHPSSRASHRVPFGTGRSVRRALEEPGTLYQAYAPETYRALRRWMAYVSENPGETPQLLHRAAAEADPVLAAFLDTTGFLDVWPKLHQGVHVLPQFHRWFDALRTLKTVHYLRDQAHPQVSVFQTLAQLLLWQNVVCPVDLTSLQQTDLDTQQRLLQWLREHMDSTAQTRGIR